MPQTSVASFQKLSHHGPVKERQRSRTPAFNDHMHSIITHILKSLSKNHNHPVSRCALNRILMPLATLVLAALPAFGTGYVDVRSKPGRPPEHLPVRLLADVPGDPAKTAPDARSPYGGDIRTRLDSSGFFRTHHLADGSWTLVDPDGHPFFNLAIGGVRSINGKSQTTADALQSKFGGAAQWGDAVVRMLRENGFNGTGAWSQTDILRAASQHIPYTLIWDFMGNYGRSRGDVYQQPGHLGYPGGVPFVFDPGFENFCDASAQKLDATKDDPWLLGHFSDNELPWPADALNRYLRLPETEAGHRAALSWLRQQRGIPDLPPTAETTEKEREDFLRCAVERYYRIVATAIRKHDPNHLFLGSRLKGSDLRTPSIWEAAGRHCDIVSANVYFMWTPDKELTANWQRWSGRPFMVTEWYAKGMDTGLPNVSGAGWVVPTQADRAKFYQHFALHMLEAPGCVGLHWFRYMDNDPADLSVDPSNRDSNKGIVNIKFEPYAPLLAGMKELNDRIYAIRDLVRRHTDATP